MFPHVDARMHVVTGLADIENEPGPALSRISSRSGTCVLSQPPRRVVRSTYFEFGFFVSRKLTSNRYTSLQLGWYRYLPSWRLVVKHRLTGRLRPLPLGINLPAPLASPSRQCRGRSPLYAVHPTAWPRELALHDRLSKWLHRPTVFKPAYPTGDVRQWQFRYSSPFGSSASACLPCNPWAPR